MMEAPLSSYMILHKLLDKAENSTALQGTSTRRIQINTKKEYRDVYNSVRCHEAEEGIRYLEEKGIVTVDRTGRTTTKIYLVSEKISEAYRLAHRTPKSEKVQSLTDILDLYACASPTCRAYTASIRAQLKKSGKTKHLAKQENLRRDLYIISSMENNTGETAIKDFSAKLSGLHSKSLTEKNNALLHHIVTIMTRYGDYMDEDEVLNKNHIFRNPYAILLKGEGILETTGGKTIDLSIMPGGIGILQTDIGSVKAIRTKKLLTVENETTYYSIPHYRETTVIFLSGFATKARLQLIKSALAEEYYHSGDIDAGGFRILKHLREESGKAFRPFGMDLKTIQSCSQTQKLKPADRKALKLILDESDEFGDLIRYMLATGCKAEQETFSYGDIL